MTDVFLVILIAMLCIVSYQINQLKEYVMSNLSDAINGLSAGVATCETVVGSVEQLVTNLSTAVAALTAQLAAAGVDPALVAQAQALQTKLDADNTALAAFVVANTPAAKG